MNRSTKAVSAVFLFALLTLAGVPAAHSAPAGALPNPAVPISWGIPVIPCHGTRAPPFITEGFRWRVGCPLDNMASDWRMNHQNDILERRRGA